jgi:hypothetical protein
MKEVGGREKRYLWGEIMRLREKYDRERADSVDSALEELESAGYDTGLYRTALNKALMFREKRGDGKT